MKTTLALILAFIACAAAFYPPQGQPNGAYHVRVDEHGVAVITTAFDFSNVKSARDAVPATARNKLQKRAFPCDDDTGSCPSPACTGYTLDADDYDHNLSECMSYFLGSNNGDDVEGIAPKTVFYCRSGDNLLAICNYSGQGNHGFADELTTFTNGMDDECGKYQSGYIAIPQLQKTYWRTRWGEGICDDLGYSRQEIPFQGAN